MPCPFYGRHASELMRVMVPSHGNQCALITNSFSPCRMEQRGDTPNLQDCEFNGSRAAIEFASFSVRGLQRDYPD